MQSKWNEIKKFEKDISITNIIFSFEWSIKLNIKCRGIS